MTTLDSEDGYREYIQGFRDAGELELTGFHDADDSGQAALRAAYDSGAAGTASIAFADGTDGQLLGVRQIARHRRGRGRRRGGLRRDAAHHRRRWTVGERRLKGGVAMDVLHGDRRRAGVRLRYTIGSMCAMEDRAGGALEALLDRPFTAARLLLWGGMLEDQPRAALADAGRRIDAHLAAGGTLDEIVEACAEALRRAGFLGGAE